eukprot:2080363-Rhodomonas_salina.2
MPGTDQGYAPTRCAVLRPDMLVPGGGGGDPALVERVLVRLMPGTHRRYLPTRCAVLTCCTALFAYARATPCPVLTARMLLSACVRVLCDKRY